MAMVNHGQKLNAALTALAVPLAASKAKICAWIRAGAVAHLVVRLPLTSLSEQDSAAAVAIAEFALAHADITVIGPARQRHVSHWASILDHERLQEPIRSGVGRPKTRGERRAAGSEWVQAWVGISCDGGRAPLR